MRWLKRLFAPRASPASHGAFWIHVRCQRCREAIRVRVDRRYDLVSEMRDPGEPGPAYTVHKDIVGARCFQRIAVDLAFDTRLEVVERRITGGEWLSEAEYVTATTTSAQPPGQ